MTVVTVILRVGSVCKKPSQPSPTVTEFERSIKNETGNYSNNNSRGKRRSDSVLPRALIKTNAQEGNDIRRTLCGQSVFRERTCLIKSKAKKEEDGSPRPATPCPPIRPLCNYRQRILFFRFAVGVGGGRLGAGQLGSRAGSAEGRSALCPSESAVPLIVIVACGNRCQRYYGVTFGTKVKMAQRKEMIIVSEKRISHCQGKGSLTHNNRKFSAKNVDEARTKDNVVFVKQGIEEAYEQLFGAAVERYNAKQKRADRKIKTSYYEHLFKRSPAQSVVTSADKRKSFYEDVVQIGTMQDTGVGTPDAEIAAACLTEYMQGFQERNPNFYVFNAVLHLDEATPHLHIDYIPIGHYKQGIDTQNGIAQALKEMGYGTGKDAIARWRESECMILTEICNRHGIQTAAPEKSRGSLTVEQYKEYAQVKEQVDEKKEEVARLDEQYQEKTTALNETTAALESNQSLLETSAQKVAQIKSINEIETGKTFLGGKVTLSKEDYGTLSDLAKKQIAADNKENELTAEIAKLKKKNEEFSAEKEQLTEQNAELRKENGELQSIYGRIAIAKIRSERDNLQRQLDRVMEFIRSLGLAEKLQTFFYPNRREKHR